MRLSSVESSLSVIGFKSFVLIETEPPDVDDEGGEDFAEELAAGALEGLERGFFNRRARPFVANAKRYGLFANVFELWRRVAEYPGCTPL